ncbi:vitellogenin-1-like isoform X1 [Bradysia coprophila]|uniref:vitellogenin-1-like isoform X1 n=1 Tax=Bradysia coprophila TaxID=38358 RepID=UPI00187D8A17|nr:vitellogenin-1-like isoform X1 [Bradysia coprophila]
MLVVRVLRNSLHLRYIVTLLANTIIFVNAQYVPNFLSSAFEFGRRFQPDHVVRSAIDASTGLLLTAQNAPIPTPVEFFDIGINLIVGYPTEQVFNAINTFCSFSLAQKQVKPKVLPDLNKMNYLLKTPDRDYLIPIETPGKLWRHPAFNRELETTFLVTGWFSNINSTLENDALETVWEAYKCRGNLNFVVIDAADYVDTLYTWSAFNTEEIGKSFAKGLAELVKIYSEDNIHLVGHSLGAHIVGAAGRYFTEFTSKSLPRITGLDPASPCFNEGENLSGLSRGDALFVDVIHSNSGVLGKKDPVGDVDFYPNGVNPLPPGCLTIVCAHARSWEFFAESVYPGNERAYMATKCNSITSLNSGSCPGKRIPMGIDCPRTAKGNYFLTTKRSKPFGENALKESEINCARREPSDDVSFE